MHALVRMYPAQENQAIAARFPQRIKRKIDPVIDGRQIVQPGSPIGIADRDKIPASILLIYRHDSRRRKSVNRGEDRSLYQACVRQSHEVVMAVDEIELSGVLEGLGNMKVFGDFRIDPWILFISSSYDGVKPGAGDGIAGGEQCHIPTAGGEPFGNVAGNRLPCAVMPRRRSPGDGSKNGHSLVGHLGPNSWRTARQPVERLRNPWRDRRAHME